MFVCGRSLGGAVAIHTLAKLGRAGDDYIKGALIENTFTNISDMADRLFGFFKPFKYIKMLIMNLKWDSL